MGRVCSIHGMRSNAHNVLTGKPEGMRQLGRPDCRWDGNIKNGS
jgi:hypothetical protein